MRYEKYENVVSSSNRLEFQFISEGPKGKIKKVIQFSQTKNKDIYNLAFGNLNNDGTIDDETTNDNKDRNKILATVAATVYEFTARYTDKTIFFYGSTAERTRLYRMALSTNIKELEKDFYVYGILQEKFLFRRVPFQKVQTILAL